MEMESAEDDRPLDWRDEAAAVIRDVKNHVGHVAVSEALQNTISSIHLNVATLEGKRYCVELNGEGFAIVGDEFDMDDGRDSERFETPYSLLSSISAEYIKSFGRELVEKLSK